MKRFVLVSVALVAVAAACGDDDVGSYAPLSEACDRCLSLEEEGCSAEWEACEAESACEEHVLCELRVGCYERASGDCAESCEPPEGEAGTLAATFEACARTTCAETCAFSEE